MCLCMDDSLCYTVETSEHSKKINLKKDESTFLREHVDKMADIVKDKISGNTSVSPET